MTPLRSTVAIPRPTTIMTSTALNPFKSTPDEKLITSTMVNNYVKQKIIAPPKNKKYSRNQIIFLFVVGVLKQVFSISNIDTLVKLALKIYPL